MKPTAARIRIVLGSLLLLVGLGTFPRVSRIARGDSLGNITGAMPLSAGSEGASAGWRKYEANPVLGGNLGTCFDVTLLQDNDVYRMWFSWRP